MIILANLISGCSQKNKQTTNANYSGAALFGIDLFTEVCRFQCFVSDLSSSHDGLVYKDTIHKISGSESYLL
jgi:hypothetical protein